MRHVTFCQNYYWIGTNSATNLQDSRLFGFVPQNHLIGRASLIWFSKDQSKGPFTGYRWERMGRAVK